MHQALQIAVEAYERTSSGLATRAVAAGLRALIDYLASEPAHAHLSLVDTFAASPEAIEIRNADDAARFAAYLQPGYELAPQGPRDVPAIAAEAIAGGVWQVLHHYVENDCIAELPDAAPQLTYFALAPFLGPRRRGVARRERWASGARSRRCQRVGGLAFALGPRHRPRAQHAAQVLADVAPVIAVTTLSSPTVCEPCSSAARIACWAAPRAARGRACAARAGLRRCGSGALRHASRSAGRPPAALAPGVRGARVGAAAASRPSRCAALRRLADRSAWPARPRRERARSPGRSSRASPRSAAARTRPQRAQLPQPRVDLGADPRQQIAPPSRSPCPSHRAQLSAAPCSPLAGRSRTSHHSFTTSSAPPMMPSRKEARVVQSRQRLVGNGDLEELAQRLPAFARVPHQQALRRHGRLDRRRSSAPSTPASPAAVVRVPGERSRSSSQFMRRISAM